jgi:hypothetical protein
VLLAAAVLIVMSGLHHHQLSPVGWVAGLTLTQLIPGRRRAGLACGNLHDSGLVSARNPASERPDPQAPRGLEGDGAASSGRQPSLPPPHTMDRLLTAEEVAELLA